MKKRNCNSIKAVLLVLLMGLCGLSFAVQSIYSYKGFFFKHPYFENKNLYTAQNSVQIEASENLLNAQPEAITYTGTDDKTFGAYISGDSIYLFTADPVQDFCYSLLEYTEPEVLPLVGVGIDSGTAIYAVKSATADVFKLCVGGSDGRIYIYSIDPVLLSIMSSDTIVLNNATGRRIASINGVSSSYNSVDSVLWITGSNGLLRSVRLGQNSIGVDSIFDIAAAENVTCYGDGIAGTDAGSVFERNGATFEKVLSVTGALQSVNGRALAGNGIVYVKSSSGWINVKENGAVRYRECIVSANSSGSLYELIDENWDIDSVSGSNSSTLIASVTPLPLMSYLNSQNKYEYKEEISELITVTLSDYEKNYEPLSIVLKTDLGSTEIGTKSEGMELSNFDPSGSCSTGILSFADSSVKIALSPVMVTVTTSVLGGIEDLICMQCALKQFSHKNEIQWGLNDELIISSSTQIISIVNRTGATAILFDSQKIHKKILISAGKYNSFIDIPAGSEIKDARVFDLTGQIIKADITGDDIKISQTVSRVLTLQLRLMNGKIVTARTILTRR